MLDSLRGQFLVAGRNLRDQNFFKTIVLMVEHDGSGAMGLVVNRPSAMPVSQALFPHFEIPETEEVVFAGGPVDERALFVLHNQPKFMGGESAVVPGMYIGTSAEVFEEVIHAVEAGGSDLRFRIFAGCAGWGPGQLEEELSRGDWYLHPASAEHVFNEDPYELWDVIVKQLGERNSILPDSPADPEWN